jgi:hypothetical protein
VQGREGGGSHVTAGEGGGRREKEGERQKLPAGVFSKLSSLLGNAGREINGDEVGIQTTQYSRPSIIRTSVFQTLNYPNSSH